MMTGTKGICCLKVSNPTEGSGFFGANLKIHLGSTILINVWFVRPIPITMMCLDVSLQVSQPVSWPHRC
jgi:hypothetical protein